MYIGYTPIQDKEAIMLLTLPENSGRYETIFDLVGFKKVPSTEETDADPGYWSPVTAGNDGNGNYFSVRGDFTDYQNGIVLGYNYNSSQWYEESYKILNKNYKIPKITFPISFVCQKYQSFQLLFRLFFL